MYDSGNLRILPDTERRCVYKVHFQYLSPFLHDLTNYIKNGLRTRGAIIFDPIDYAYICLMEWTGILHIVFWTMTNVNWSRISVITRRVIDKSNVEANKCLHTV